MKDFLNSIKTFIYGLNPTYVGIAVLIIMLAISIIVLILVNHLIKSGQIKQSYENTINNSKLYLNTQLKDSKVKAFNFEEIESYINRSGLGFMTGYKITPLTYTLIKLFIAIIFMIAGLQENLFIGLILLPVGYFGLDFIINQSDKADNAAMLDDIKNIYDTLRIQTKAGVYITSVITDCYLVVQNTRLKDALLKLTSDIAAKNDVEDALDKFRAKFNNDYINTLVIIIKQSMKTGQASKMFEDIRNQITDIEAAMVMNEKISIQTKITLVQLLLYSTVIVVAIFIAMTSLSTGLTFS